MDIKTSHSWSRAPTKWVTGLEFPIERSRKYGRMPHNRLLFSLAHGFEHPVARLGNPDFCSDGPLPNLT